MELDDRGVVATCPSCGTKNRFTYPALHRTTRCGKCHTTLAAPSAPIDVYGTRTFDAMISASSIPIVVDFWAPWCGPCRMMAPQFEIVAQHMAGNALVVKVNTDEEQELSARYGIRSIPTIAVFQDGREVTRVAGARPAAEVEKLVPLPRPH